jgi:Uncharacterized conserved protein (DUF2203)
MGTVTEICKYPIKTEFTLREANDLLPTIRRIFKKHEQRIKKLLSDQRFYIASGAPQERITECDNLVGQEMSWCGTKCFKLGTKVLGDGFLGFDSGVFFWSWMYDEEIISNYHAYDDNPRFKRHKINILYPVKHD